MKERKTGVQECFRVLESLKPKLARFIEEKLYSWGLGLEDVLLVDEAGFGYAGVPIYGPELIAAAEEGKAHIDIAVREEKYRGPESTQTHPTKILLPADTAFNISQVYGIAVWDFIKGRDFFKLPTLQIFLNDVEVLVPEPVSHVRMFAQDTILYYSLEQAGEAKIREWYTKLKEIQATSMQINNLEVSDAAEEMIKLSRERWKAQGWSWL